jgi:hypothetical protein
MGRTVPSFRLALEMEKADWKPFRNALSKTERKEFDDMFDIPKLYISACSNSVQLVPLQPIIISILFHHYKDLTQCMSEIEQIQSKVNSKKAGELTIKEDNTKTTNQTGQQQLDFKLSSQKDRRGRPRMGRKRKSLIIEKEDYRLDSYLTNNKITES